MNLTVTSEDIATVVVRFADSLENEEFDNSSLEAQKRIENMLQSDYSNGIDVLDLLALDQDGNVVGRLTAQEFFDEKMGF